VAASSTPAPGRYLGWLLVGTAGLSACITIVFLSMRAVMDIGGACASGGPYVSANPCPDGVGLLMSFAFPAGFGFAALAGWAGSRIGRACVAVPLLAWPALFLSLGWNFIEYGLVSPPEGETVVWGWLVPGILFIAMGGIPLVLALLWRNDFGNEDRAAALRARLRRGQIGAMAPMQGSGWSAARVSGAEEQDGLVDRLERLARLRADGTLTDTEFEAAKAATIRDAESAR
jgi:hypothetical protein